MNPKFEYIVDRHPLSMAFPDMNKDEYSDLLDSIKKIGIQNPIVVFEDKIIDGWHRYKVSCELDIDCPTIDLEDGIDPCLFVIAQNASRRNMSPSQRALATVTVNAWRPSGKRNEGNPQDYLQKTNEALIQSSNTSETTIIRAKKVIADAVPEVIDAVKLGTIGIKKASEIAKLPAKDQVAAISQPIPKKPAINQPIEKKQVEEYVGPSNEEIEANEIAARADLESMNKLLDADDKLKEAFDEIHRLNAQNAGLRQARDRYMNQCNEQIRMIKSLQKKLDKLTKE